jgi:hypothetical protein
MKTARIRKDRSTPEKEKFWTSAEEAIQEINSWPAWKQSYLSPILTRDRDTETILVQEPKPPKKKK